jgi:hypothetical protein
MEKDTYTVEIRVHDDEGDYTEEHFDFSTRKEAFEFANKKPGNVHDIFFYPAGTDCNPKRLW